MARTACSDSIFEKNDCRRKNSFYSVNGALCYYNKHDLNCKNGNTVLAVNLGGETHTDKRGIDYVAGKDAIFEDSYQTKQEGHQIQIDKDFDDKELYSTFILGKSNGTDFGQCIRYLVDLPNDGDYELTFRAIEPEYRDVRERVRW